jgi:hypothetical protein
MKKAIALLILILIFINIAADPYDLSKVNVPRIIKSYIKNNILKWINNRLIVNSVKEANWKNRNRKETEIIEQDKRWRDGDSDFINLYLNNKAAKYLQEILKKSNGSIAEIFVMDFQGCNVATANKTTDFWQGDEAKFKNSYNNGKGSVFVSDAEFDESTNSFIVQISLPIVDPSTNKVIGAITIGIDLDKF